MVVEHPQPLALVPVQGQLAQLPDRGQVLVPAGPLHLPHLQLRQQLDQKERAQEQEQVGMLGQVAIQRQDRQLEENHRQRDRQLEGNHRQQGHRLAQYQ